MYNKMLGYFALSATNYIIEQTLEIKRKRCYNLINNDKYFRVIK